MQNPRGLFFRNAAAILSLGQSRADRDESFDKQTAGANAGGDC